MAVTINEMNVEVKPPVAPAAAAPTAAEKSKKVDLHSALKMLHERQHRLRVD
jgi:hypothetical protein